MDHVDAEPKELENKSFFQIEKKTFGLCGLYKNISAH